MTQTEKQDYESKIEALSKSLIEAKTQIAMCSMTLGVILEQDGETPLRLLKIWLQPLHEKSKAIAEKPII
jgi:hypothetical protein